MENLNLLFHKLYYSNIDIMAGNPGKKQERIFEDAVKERNNQIFAFGFDHKNDFLKCDIPNVKKLHMKTSYPGLLIGTGYPHGSGLVSDDIRCGFSFDYVSGQPYIPGSSVKGALRSHFKEHSKAVAEIADIPEESVKALEENIFDFGDIFLDAVLYDGHPVLGKEYITPHKETLKSPNPICILKILPDVRFEFRFIVSDFNTKTFTYTVDEKLELFKTLLTLFGVGAKTNVGFGILESDESPVRQTTATEDAQAQTIRTQENVQPQARTAPPAASDPDKIICPHCGAENYRRDKKGNLNEWCYNLSCQKALDGSDAINRNPKIKCSHCNTINFVYDLQGKKNKTCFNKDCRKPLP